MRVKKRVKKRACRIWKTIMVGGASVDQLLTKLVDAGRNVDFWARRLMDRSEFITSETPHEVSFCRETVEDLGFSDDATLSQIIGAIKKLGGDPCQLEDAAWLALENQSYNDIFWVVTERVIDPYGYLEVFFVRFDFDSGRRLCAYHSNPADLWVSSASFVFRSNK